jgi:hypothetical protein
MDFSASLLCAGSSDAVGLAGAVVSGLGETAMPERCRNGDPPPGQVMAMRTTDAAQLSPGQVAQFQRTLAIRSHLRAEWEKAALVRQHQQQATAPLLQGAAATAAEAEAGASGTAAAAAAAAALQAPVWFDERQERYAAK